MGNPYAPASGRVRRSSEMRDPLAEIRDRLRNLGASTDEIDDWTGTESWSDLDDEQRESVTELRAASDDEIKFQIEAVRAGDPDDDLEDLEQAGEGEVTQGVDHIDPAIDAAASAAIGDPLVGHGDEIPTADAAVGDSLPPLPDSAYPPDAETLPEAQMTQGPALEPTTVEEVDEPAVEIPAGLLDENVPEILEKVGDDKQLAAAVLELESLTDKPRKTLVEPLREVIDAAEDDGAPT